MKPNAWLNLDQSRSVWNVLPELTVPGSLAGWNNSSRRLWV
jgi:hypothetical protein